ncbi:UvrD-helicase domain-containing protein [Demequina sp. SYSU T00192]|uniref:DNA 3'-5' helicase n=1 Tax=Demequina litoralis TaxID=3051660 RepID=A0ABT8G678_9MICO|nr:UvrD-helicase domain-containing protein [Demequina sp. SYSU T00192]MDN4474644.1 UvrD-helicase domain-containing protein [Demequina sp. SYSU T00192]
MTQRWTGRTGWTLTRDGSRLTLAVDGSTAVIAGRDAARLSVSWWWFRRCLRLEPVDGTRRLRLPGLDRVAAREIDLALTRIVTRAKVREAVATAAAREPVFERLLATRVRLQRWIAYDDASAILAGLPRHADVMASLTAAERAGLDHHLTETERRALDFLSQDHRGRVAAANAEIARRELIAGRSFFDAVERTPLTDEQARAVVTFDNRVRVIAAAGSGKTSVMVARAAYAVRRGLVDPDRILMLAFNADAATELRGRVDARLGALGLPSEGIRASTFHAFGRAVIGEATGRAPRIAPWVEGGRDVDKVRELIATVRADAGPDAPSGAMAAQPDKDLAPLVRTFMSHVKANALTREDVARRLARTPELDTARTRAFLDLCWRVHARWDAELRATGTVDFDDMLVRAAELLEADPSLARWDLVMVDEFQDTSRARARLMKALLQGRGKHLLAVGDDWQAINRFAGADLSVMTDFGTVFGPALTRRLQTTFRTTQVTADVAGRFVSRNPAQIAKTVRSARGPGGAPVRVVRVARKGDLARAVEARLEELAGASPGATVDVLGRYGFDQKLVPTRRFDGLEVRFRTVHRSKGLEADHVILPNVTRGRYGFPGTIGDDPVLSLAIAADDGYPDAEERRLFYVALTRARQTVTILTVRHRESPFVLELLEDPDVEVVDAAAPLPTEAARP